MRGWVAAIQDARLRRARATHPTYPPADGARARTWDEFDRRTLVGQGWPVFEAARAALFGWQMQRHAGIAVHPQGAVPRAGETVLLSWSGITAPLRVVDMVDTDRRAGFTYATLPGHPECGRESFLVEQDDTGAVGFTLTAVSRPARWYARVGAPVTRLVQRRITDRYVAAIVAGAARRLP